MGMGLLTWPITSLGAMKMDRCLTTASGGHILARARWGAELVRRYTLWCLNPQRQRFSLLGLHISPQFIADRPHTIASNDRRHRCYDASYGHSHIRITSARYPS